MLHASLGVPVDGKAYDRQGGGTSTLEINPFTRQLERDFISLSGTTVNCAGGVTPWHSWITCEETSVGPTATGWGRRMAFLYKDPGGPVLRFCFAKKDETLRAAVDCLVRI
ncbi:MAG: alkaline phosphatase PhoX [Vicinamibacterales bacterium]